uniref:Preterminal protein n=1 Tax=Bat mastadenovirus TaxID=740971 RepID=A0A894JFB4_9ADEN|nr:DNA terminal protein [Bat mastadenovirus]
MSKYVYRYHRLMLMNLSPREPATRHWPLYSWPPPHFLVGYQYLVRICNDYMFDSRAYSRIKYTEILLPMQQKMNWTVLANCAYTVNTGAFHRFVDMENFNETLQQVQQSILADRVIADLALTAPMTGYGAVNMEPEGYDLGRMFEQYKNLSQSAWGMAGRYRIEHAGRKDLVLLTTIRKLKTAFFNFLMSKYFTKESLSLPCDCCWIEAFLEKFSDPDFLSPQEIHSVPMQETLKCIISALSMPQLPAIGSLSGGAFQLRPRENGLAVTEQMRRQRGEIIEQFVDRLPIRRRRRRQPPPSPPEEAPSPPEPIASPESPETSFTEEVRQTIALIIQQLQEELTVSARNEEFFNFSVYFYQVLNDLERNDNLNELTVQRWVMYFFITEHVATTLNYLHHALRVYGPFARLVELNLAQVVMRARNTDGNLIFSRVWNEHGVNAFSRIMNRITVDLSGNVQRAGAGPVQEEEMEQFMSDIAFQENSGDISDILAQAAIHDAEIDSIELSFRFKVTGPVAFTQHREIQLLNKRVIAYASQLRRQRLPLPALNQDIALPPLI